MRVGLSFGVSISTFSTIIRLTPTINFAKLEIVTGCPSSTCFLDNLKYIRKYPVTLIFLLNFAHALPTGSRDASKICIKLRCATNSEKGFGEYIIDTDFVGDREFILVESDNGERTDHGFEKDEGVYGIFRSSLNNDRRTEISVETEGNTSGVRMSSINACEHVYEVLKDPTVTVGGTSLTFECELMSSDYIEFDGKTASVTDRYGNSKQIWFSSGLEVPEGEFEASVSATPLNRCVPRCSLTFGFDGPEVLRVPFNGG